MTFKCWGGGGRGVSLNDSVAVSAEVERSASAVQNCYRKEEELRQEIRDKEAQVQRYIKETQAARSEYTKPSRMMRLANDCSRCSLPCPRVDLAC